MVGLSAMRRMIQRPAVSRFIDVVAPLESSDERFARPVSNPPENGVASGLGTGRRLLGLQQPLQGLASGHARFQAQVPGGCGDRSEARRVGEGCGWRVWR